MVKNYTISVQKQSSFSLYEKEKIETIIDSIKFDIDATLSEPSSGFNSSSLWEDAIIGGVVAAIISGISVLVNRRNDYKKDETNKNSKKSNILKTLGLILLSFISSDMLLMLLLGDSVEGILVFIMLIIVTIPFYFLYNALFKEKQKEVIIHDDISKEEKNIVKRKVANIKENEDIIICECGCKVLKSFSNCSKCRRIMR